jgi:glycosyltransferase involved in cell wall biosynthesis
MNILLVNINIGKPWGWGGIESHTETLASILAKRGHKVIMGCWNDGSVKVAGGLVLPATRITMRNSGDIIAILRLMKVCRREDIQVVIANCGREYWPATIAALMTGARVIIVRHQLDKIRKTTRWLIEKYIERVVAVSRAVEGVLIEYGVPPQKIEVIYNSIPLQKFDPDLIDRNSIREELGLKGEDILVGTVGKLHRGKGVYELLSALEMLAGEYPMLKLIYIGEGPEMPGLQAQAQKLSLAGKIIFAGIRKDIERMYAAMDIFVLPSTCEEAFGMVLIEAMAMGRPVIGTLVGGMPEIIEHERNGLLVPPGDPQALAHSITRYIKDPDFSKRIAGEGCRTVELQFSAEAMGNHFEKLLREIV